MVLTMMIDGPSPLATQKTFNLELEVYMNATGSLLLGSK